jgi:hypothetical protein
VASPEPDEDSGSSLADESTPASATVDATALDILSATTMAKSPNVTIGRTVDLIDLQYLDGLPMSYLWNDEQPERLLTDAISERKLVSSSPRAS